MSSDVSPDPLAEAREMIDALLEDYISPEDGLRLERMVCERKDVRRLYIRYVHLSCSLPPQVEAPLTNLEDDKSGPEADPFSSAGVVPAIRGADVPDEVVQTIRLVPQERAPVAPAASNRAGRRSMTSLRRIGPAAAALAACVALAIWLYDRAQPPARLAATAGIQWDGRDSLSPDARLAAGQTLRSRSGAFEVAFASGARVVVEGPAAFRLVDRNRAVLDYGKLVGHVPPAARGFAVSSANLVVTDLGTEFGLSVTEAGRADVEVFEGTVEVGRPHPADAAEQPARLEKGQSVSCAVAGGGVHPVASPPPFARELPQVRAPVPVHSTGAFLSEGYADPYWQIVAESFDPGFQPRPAVVTQGLSGHYIPNDPQRSQWISTAGNLPDVPPGSYTFKTTIDLTGFDPQTVRLDARVSADDTVTDVLVNGRSTGLNTRVAREWSSLHDMTISGGFQPGVNEVAFVVFNNPFGPASLNPMALRVEWKGTAAPLVVR